MPSFPDLLILRHGETEWNCQGRMQGASDSPLTATGRAQAKRQGELLAGFGVSGWSWFASPQGRAKATAEIAGKGIADNILPDERLAEITLGKWTGRTRQEILLEAPHLFENDDSLIWYDHAPGGEGLAGLAERTMAFLTSLSTPSVIVTHGITSRVLRCHALGLDPNAFGTLPGGQGVVYHVSQGQQTCLGEGA